MDTSKMLHLEELTTKRALDLFLKSEQLRNFANELYETMEIAFVRNQILEVVHNYYDIGEIQDVYEIFGGYVNKSFGIYAVKDGKKEKYFIRKYKKEITEKEIMLEHSLIDFAKENGMDIAAGLIKTKDGGTYVKVKEEANGEEIDRYFAIYEFLDGEDKYTWITPNLNDEEYVSSAETLAIFHNASRNFDPKGLERVEPKVMELVPTLPESFREYSKLEFENNIFHDYFKQHLDEIIKVIDKTLNSIPPEAVEKMPMNPIHCDIHPGNLKFKNNKVVGIFDFDWAKIDIRIFDVCEALAYFCSSWEPETDGQLRLSKCAIFLKAYQDKLKELGGLEPLNETELKYFPEMMAIANIYLINWCVPYYYADPSLNVYEYRAYLQHHIKLMRFIERHKEDLAEIVKTL